MIFRTYFPCASGWLRSHWEVSDGSMYFGGDKITPAPKSTWIFTAVWKDDDSQNGNTEYTVQWIYSDDGSIIKEETRKGTANSPVSVNEQDKALAGYIYDEGNTANLEQAILAADNTTVLKLHFTVDPNFVDNGKGISITKTPAKTTAKVGDIVTWNIVVKNESNVTKTVTLTEGLAGATLSKDTVTLAAGASETVTATYTVKAEDGDSLVNTVTATTDGDPDKPATSDPIKVDNGKGISIEKKSSEELSLWL